MKILYSDEWATLYQAACPQCDLPLYYAETRLADDPPAWIDGDHEVFQCPRCLTPLDEIRPVEPVDMAAVERLEAFAGGRP